MFPQGRYTTIKVNENLCYKVFAIYYFLFTFTFYF